MYWYALVGMLAIMVLIVVNYDVLFQQNKRSNISAMESYKNFLYGIMACCIADMLWGILGSLHLSSWLFVEGVVYYIVMAVNVMLWTQYVVVYLAEVNAFSRFLSLAGRIFFVAAVAITIVHCFTPILFWFDGNGDCRVGEFWHAQLVFQILLLLLSSAYLFLAMKRTEGAVRKRRRTICLFGVVVAVLLIAQMKYPFLPLYTVAYMLGNCLLHVFVVNDEMEEYRQDLQESLQKSVVQEQKSRFLAEMMESLHVRITAIANIYVLVCEFDLVADAYTMIKLDQGYTNYFSGKRYRDAQEVLRGLAKERCDSSCVDAALEFVDLSTLEDRLEKSNVTTMEYRAKSGAWGRARFIASKRDEVGRLANVLYVSEDISVEKAEREKLRDMTERAIAANEAKTSFLSNMSHEIRTPINAILGMNEMILRESEDKNILTYSGSIRTAGGTLLGIVNDILDFSKIEAGKMELIPVNYDLSSVINDLVNMVKARADEKGLEIILDIGKDVPKMLKGDEIRLKQIIMNILTNAVKYTEKGSVTFSVGFERIEEDPDNVMLCVAVRDTGIGIKPEDIERLFMKFERIEEMRNRYVEGTGLGMAITQNLLDMMGSSLQVESVYGRGSTFSFRLKQKVVKWEPLGDYEGAYHAFLKGREEYREKFTAPEACVLMVDDNPMNLTVFKNLLKRTRVRIDTANDGSEGLLLMQDKKYDLIFLDHMMPGKDGIETLHELRAQQGSPNIDTPAICLTANAISGARDRYIEAGFDDYLTKPLDSGKLEDMMMDYLPKEKIEAAGTEEISAGSMEIPEILAPLKEEDWIDLNLGMENSGDAESYLELLQIFYESIDEKTEEIDGFYVAEDLKNYTIKVHALKSSARIIGARDFGEEAQKLENAGKSGDLDYIRAHHADFLETCRSFRAPLAEVFAVSKAEEGAGEEKPEADEKQMEGIYKELRAAAEEMDCERLDAIFARMEGYRIPAKDAELYGKLKAASDRFDYDSVLSLLDTRIR